MYLSDDLYRWYQSLLGDDKNLIIASVEKALHGRESKDD